MTNRHTLLLACITLCACVLSTATPALQCQLKYSPLFQRCLADVAEITEDYRLQAGQAFAGGNHDKARELLGQGITSAKEVKDPYTRVNQLRYLAQLYFQLGDIKKSRKIFADAMHITPQITMVERRFSAVIGVVELQHASGDVEGTRDNTLHALQSGILEAQVKTGKAGETGRFLTNLKGVLAPADILTIMRHTFPLSLPDMRMKIWRKLAFQPWASPPYAEPATLLETLPAMVPETLETPLETLAVHCIQSRLFTAYDQYKQAAFYTQAMHDLLLQTAQDVSAGNALDPRYDAAYVKELQQWQRGCKKALASHESP